mgnify:CR=1 FL=1
MSYKKNNQSNPKSILGKAKDIYQGSAKILKDPTKAMIKVKFNLNQIGKRNIEQAKDASKTNLDKTKLSLLKLNITFETTSHRVSLTKAKLKSLLLSTL